MDKFEELAMEVVRKVLTAYGFAEDEDKEKEDRDYGLEVTQNDDSALVIDICAQEWVSAILIGKDGINHSAFQRVCYSALGAKMESKIPKGFFITVDGRRPEIRNGHSTVSEPPKPVVTIIVPAGIEVRTRTEGEKPKVPRRR